MRARGGSSARRWGWLQTAPLAPRPPPALQNKMHINDWAAIQTLFDKLNKQLERTQKVTQSLGVPRAYVRMMCELEDFMAKTLAGAPPAGAALPAGLVLASSRGGPTADRRPPSLLHGLQAPSTAPACCVAAGPQLGGACC